MCFFPESTPSQFYLPLYIFNLSTSTLRLCNDPEFSRLLLSLKVSNAHKDTLSPTLRIYGLRGSNSTGSGNPCSAGPRVLRATNPRPMPVHPSRTGLIRPNSSSNLTRPDKTKPVIFSKMYDKCRVRRQTSTNIDIRFKEHIRNNNKKNISRNK